LLKTNAIFSIWQLIVKIAIIKANMGNCSFKHDDEVTPSIGGNLSKLNTSEIDHFVVNISKYNFTF